MSTESARSQNPPNEKFPPITAPTQTYVYSNDKIPNSYAAELQAPVFAAAQQFVPRMSKGPSKPTSFDKPSSIKLLPLKMQTLSENPFIYYEWISLFFSLVHNSVSITDIPRIAPLQFQVNQELKRAYSRNSAIITLPTMRQ